jgi:hypothetical protein
MRMIKQVHTRGAPRAGIVAPRRSPGGCGHVSCDGGEVECLGDAVEEDAEGG